MERDSANFSQLQIEKYLESTKLRKEMDRAMRENGANSRNIANDAGDLAKKIAAHHGVEYVSQKRGWWWYKWSRCEYSQYKRRE